MAGGGFILTAAELSVCAALMGADEIYGIGWPIKVTDEKALWTSAHETLSRKQLMYDESGGRVSFDIDFAKCMRIYIAPRIIASIRRVSRGREFLRHYFRGGNGLALLEQNAANPDEYVLTQYELADWPEILRADMNFTEITYKYVPEEITLTPDELEDALNSGQDGGPLPENLRTALSGAGEARGMAVTEAGAEPGCALLAYGCGSAAWLLKAGGNGRVKFVAVSQTEYNEALNELLGAIFYV